MKNFEKSICLVLNNLASNNKVIFYIFKSITYTGEWWMYVVYGIIITIIDYHKGYEALQMGLIAYGMHYPIYFLIKKRLSI